METAAVFMHWSVIVQEPERVLDDLARWTGINTLLYRFHLEMSLSLQSVAASRTK